MRSDSKQTSDKMIHHDRRRGIRLGPCRPSTALSQICTSRHPALPAMRVSASGWRVVPVLPFGDVTVNRRGLPREQDVSFRCRPRRRIWPWTRSQLASFVPHISTHHRLCRWSRNSQQRCAAPVASIIVSRNPRSCCCFHGNDDSCGIRLQPV